MTRTDKRPTAWPSTSRYNSSENREEPRKLNTDHRPTVPSPSNFSHVDRERRKGQKPTARESSLRSRQRSRAFFPQQQTAGFNRRKTVTKGRASAKCWSDLPDNTEGSVSDGFVTLGWFHRLDDRISWRKYCSCQNTVRTRSRCAVKIHYNRLSACPCQAHKRHVTLNS